MSRNSLPETVHGARQRKARHAPLVAIATVGLAALALRAGALNSEDVFRMLEAQKIPFDSNVVHRAAAAAILTAADSRAMLLSQEEAQTLEIGETVEQAETWAEGIAYMKFGGMYEGGASNVKHRLLQWTNESLQGLILDVRAAGGTDLDTVDQICGMFLAADTFLYSVCDGSGTVLEEHRTSADPPCCRLPVMLLVDSTTRDASEVLCMALKKQPGAMLIGAATLGDNGLREAIPLASNVLAYVATRWVQPVYTNDYRGEGVLPDIPISRADEIHAAMVRPENGSIMKPLSEKARIDRDLMLRVAGDPALMRATDLLLGLKALRPTVSSPDSMVTEQASPDG